MFVYIVKGTYSIIGVYATKERAEEVSKEANEGAALRGEWGTYHVLEMEVK